MADRLSSVRRLLRPRPVLNLHERWLLRATGVRRPERRALFAALAAGGYDHGDVDLAGQVGTYTMVKRSIRKDLPSLFDRLLSPYQPSIDRVAYGDRRYRKQVILAAALHEAGISASDFRSGLAAGYRKLSQFQHASGPPD